ncbi:disulfide bond formation protein B [Polynucleobacter sp. JS-Polo-80-F4]|nr:disulfide bond formation protein B [Polynucleobacter sp. JS-Polo-80-F4]MBU3616930.1 disulfide bond formation protein B [Polynucleobacter sp. JS-Polo-80-F4]
MGSVRYLNISLFSLGLVIFAVILQHTGYKGVSFLPCPLCILQRVGYLGVATFCFLAAGIVPLRKPFHLLALLSAAYGASVAGRQVWLLSHPEASCGIDPLEIWINQFQLSQGIPWLFKADGLCSSRLPAILGLQVPEWSLFWFSVLFLFLLVSLFKEKT